LLAFLLAPGGYATALWVGGCGVLLLLVLGVAFRRVVPAGRMWRRDPAGTAYLAAERSHMYAVFGLVMMVGALIAMLITAAADLVVR
jgi:hypothetical protein